jgi:hypothetical protein
MDSGNGVLLRVLGLQKCGKTGENRRSLDEVLEVAAHSVLYTNTDIYYAHEQIDTEAAEMDGRLA